MNLLPSDYEVDMLTICLKAQTATQIGSGLPILIGILQCSVLCLPDKLKRTALIHAVMNGHAHVASYLLSLGADPNVSDSSGNTAIHYAAAYGWYFCLKLLLDAGADPNKPNDWKVRE